MLSERDLRVAFGVPSEGLQWWPNDFVPSRTVQESMSHPVLAVRGDHPVSEVVAVMVDRGIGAVPIIDAAERPIGIISYLDVLRTAPLRPAKADAP
jgi:CBS domain-containing protein